MASEKTAKVFGIILRELRMAAEFSQEKLALEADRDRTFLGKVERGKKLPTLETILRVASVLKTEPGAMVAKTAALINFAPSPRKRPLASTALPIYLGEETCSRCKAVYRLHVRKSTTRRKGRFQCGFCEKEIGAWTGCLTQIYTVLHPPKSWRKR
jgi:transcriptional regulator with XRE-family HTH domain